LSCDKECRLFPFTSQRVTDLAAKRFQVCNGRSSTTAFLPKSFEGVVKKDAMAGQKKIFWELSVCECYSHRATAAMFHLYQYNRLGYINDTSTSGWWFGTCFIFSIYWE